MTEKVGWQGVGDIVGLRIERKVVLLLLWFGHSRWWRESIDTLSQLVVFVCLSVCVR